MGIAKELVFLSVAPDDLYFWWNYRVQLLNFRKYGYSDKTQIVFVLPYDRISQGWNLKTKSLEVEFPEVKFFWYEDTENLFGKEIKMYNYIPLLRPHFLEKHFRLHPELKDKAIFYHDSDIVFTKYLDFKPFLNDDICYLSNTRGYIAASYWDSKIKDVREDRLSAYKIMDVLDFVAKAVGINRRIAVDNEEGSGGAQYLLKNIDADYWKDVEQACKTIRSVLYFDFPGSINNTFFTSEDKGFQSWCCDMWAVLWNLWKRKMETKCPPEMDFAWATDKIARWGEVYIYHDAGASPVSFKDEKGFEHMLFFKKGRNGTEYCHNVCTPFEHDLSYVSPEYCSWMYTKEIERAGQLLTNT